VSLGTLNESIIANDFYLQNQLSSLNDEHISLQQEKDAVRASNISMLSETERLKKEIWLIADEKSKLVT